jgi:hypothetical protein
MSIVKVAKFRKQEEVDRAVDRYKYIKENFTDTRGHWDQTKGKWIGSVIAGIPIGLGIGHLYDRKKRREAFIGPQGEEMFLSKYRK